jgi:Zn-dependent M28 family amino/carboxypeptidase
VDRPRPPVVTADEEFLEFLLAAAPVPFDDLRSRASRGEELESFTLPDVRVTIDIDHAYEVISVEHSHNVVAMVPGTDPALRDTYVLFGAHLDHVGTADGDRPPGRVNVPVAEDAIWNGADDDGSGSVAVMAIAKAMADGPRPKRSTIFIWHAGEEEGLLGSEAHADDPVVPLDRIQAVFNIDMIGRNRDNDPDQADTVFIIGADRISTDLHNLIVEANDQVARPLTIDYHYNDPGDTESFYTRSDHYSYASRGIPAAFFFTGTHPDYHANTDSVEKILFPKLVRIAQLIYEAGFGVADRPVELRRDHLGPRAGNGFRGVLPAP